MNGNDTPLLRKAARDGNTGCVTQLIAEGADVATTDILGSTPLHEAVANGRTDTVRLLEEHGGHL